MTPIALDPEGTDAGLMEQQFLHETLAPSYGDYKRDDSLEAIRPAGSAGGSPLSPAAAS